MKSILVAICALALFAAGAAAAGVDLRKIVLKPGQCVTVAKVRVCAAKAKPPTTITEPAVTVTGPPVTTTVSLPPVTVTVTTTPTPKIAFSDGTYRVGVDIEAGTYQEVGPPDSCYWARLRGFSGALSDIIANSFAGATIVTIAPTDVGFLSTRCGGWSKIG